MHIYFYINLLELMNKEKHILIISHKTPSPSEKIPLWKRLSTKWRRKKKLSSLRFSLGKFSTRTTFISSCSLAAFSFTTTFCTTFEQDTAQNSSSSSSSKKEEKLVCSRAACVCVCVCAKTGSRQSVIPGSKEKKPFLHFSFSAARGSNPVREETTSTKKRVK